MHGWRIALRNLLQCWGEERTCAYLVSLFVSGKIPFPYQRYFHEAPDLLFPTLCRCQGAVEEKRGYRLYSFYPQHHLYLPPLFRDKPYVVYPKEGDYSRADVLSDLFLEEVRLSARRTDQKKSVQSLWSDREALQGLAKACLEHPVLTPSLLRQIIYHQWPEAKTFRPTVARAVLHLVMGEELRGKRWLDISAGWGDRLLTAMSLGMIYRGYDPNIKLRPGHQRMISAFGKAGKHQVHYQPFESSNLEGIGSYDVVFSSPPYYDLEEYAPRQEGQSIVSYPDYDHWMALFLLTSVRKAWDCLAEGGYLILHVGDTRTVQLAEPLNLYIESLPNASWEGVIGVSGESHYYRPVWVWRKHPEKRRWSSTVERSFSEAYPLLAQLLPRAG